MHWSQLLLVLAAGVVLVIAVRSRRRSHHAYQQQLAADICCEHLAPALALLQDRGIPVGRVGQRAPEMPMEIHMAGDFDPAALAAEAQLQAPAHVSERGVLYCKDDWCEIHPCR